MCVNKSVSEYKSVRVCGINAHVIENNQQKKKLNKNEEK